MSIFEDIQSALDHELARTLSPAHTIRVLGSWAAIHRVGSPDLVTGAFRWTDRRAWIAPYLNQPQHQRTLERLGFDVEIVGDADAAMRRAMRQ